MAKIEIDLSKLSSGQQCDVIRALVLTLDKSSRIITEDVAAYGEGEARNDMEGWAKAARELSESIRRQALEQKIVFY